MTMYSIIEVAMHKLYLWDYEHMQASQMLEG